MLAAQGQEGRGPGREAEGRSERRKNTGEKNVFPHSALGPQLRAVQASGQGCRGCLQASPQASRPSAQLVWGPSPPPVPQELGCVCGDGQAPPPRPAAKEPSGSNIPSLLKGEVAASKLGLSRAHGWGRRAPGRQGGEVGAQGRFPALLPGSEALSKTTPWREKAPIRGGNQHLG